MCFSTCGRLFSVLILGLVWSVSPTVAQDADDPYATPATGNAEPPAKEARVCDQSAPAAKSALSAKPESSMDRLSRKLNERTTVDFFEAPLSDVSQEFSELHGLSISIDGRALEEMGIDATQLSVTKTLDNVTLRTGLSLILEDHDLVLGARGNVLVITTLDAAPLLTRVYSVDGLVHPDDNCDRLIETILDTVAPDSWAEVGGRGTVIDFQRNLCVHQTFTAHLELAELLETLRSNIELAGGPKMRP